MRSKLVIVGAGGFGIEACWVAESMNLAGTAAWEIIGFLDGNPELKGTTIGGHKVLGTLDDFVTDNSALEIFFHLALERNRVREKVAMKLSGLGWKAATLVHPTAMLGPEISIAEGCYIGPMAIVAPLARIEKFCLINAAAGIGHHAVIGEFSQICPGARVSGNCLVDRLAFIGSNATLNPGTRVGYGAIVGANSLVIRNVEPLVTVLGVPVRTISRPAKPESPAST